MEEANKALPEEQSPPTPSKAETTQQGRILSDREAVVAVLVAAGVKPGVIAKQLHISDVSVSRVKKRVKEKSHLDLLDSRVLRKVDRNIKKILDGKHPTKACEDLGTKPPTISEIIKVQEGVIERHQPSVQRLEVGHRKESHLHIHDDRALAGLEFDGEPLDAIEAECTDVVPDGT